MEHSTESKQNKALYKLVGDLFAVSASYYSGTDIILSLLPRYNKLQSIAILKDRLKMAGYKYKLNDTDESILLTIDPKPTFKIPPLNIFLFFATLFTVYIVPVYLQHATSFSDFDSVIAALKQGAGLEFTLAMISILFVHEMGHYIASRRRDIITSWPYFIPAPNIIGTFGAIIKSKSPFWNRRDLIEVGAWGPIAGWVVAVGWICYGLFHAELVPITAPEGSGVLGEPIIFQMLSYLIIGSDFQDYSIFLPEAAFAGWVGMLVTAINMLPIGQLDGGHVVYGLYKKKQHLVGYISMGFLIVLGYFSPIWWVFAFFGLMFGIKHPPTLNDSKKLNSSERLLGIIALIIFVISFTPVPFQ